MAKEEKCEVCERVFSHLARHVKVHGITYEAYVLKHKYDGVRPVCACGCGQLPNWNVASKDFVKFVHGHHMTGTTRTDETKERIGKTNSSKMSSYMSLHPEIAIVRGQQMAEARTPEVEARRIQSTKDTYANMTGDDKQGFSDHAKRLWADGDKMHEASKRGGETFTQRFEAGEYDFTERNEKISKTIAENFVNGTWNYTMGKGTKGWYVSTKTNEKHYHRSSWEFEYMKMLDADEDVVTWENEFTSLPYVFEGATHRYVPDFHVVRTNDRHQLVEIKPQALRSLEQNALKREAALEFCRENGWEYLEWELIR